MRDMSKKIVQLLEKELVVALGCTEPVAIAWAASVAKSYLEAAITSIDVTISANVMKNAMAVGIPGMKQTGIDFVAALGALAGDHERKLEVLKNVGPEFEQQALEFVEAGNVTIQLADTPKKLYIEVTVHSSSDYAKVIIEDMHTEIRRIEVKGATLFEKECDYYHEQGGQEKDICETLTLDSIHQFVMEVSLDELTLVKQSIELNRAICMEGLKNNYGLQVGKILKDNVAKGLLSDDLITHAMSVTAAGSDARMAGIMLPVMSNSGSGNQGISVTMPVVAVADKLGSSDEQMIRAVTFSHLLAIWIKSKFGRLSALCGVTVAGASAAAAITYLLGGNLNQISFAIQNTIGNVTGMLCDGAKAGCAMKVSTCTGAAVQSALLASQGIGVPGTNGIIDDGLEKTIDNFCRLGNEGSGKMDELMLEMMVKKQKK